MISSKPRYNTGLHNAWMTTIEAPEGLSLLYHIVYLSYIHSPDEGFSACIQIDDGSARSPRSFLSASGQKSHHHSTFQSSQTDQKRNSDLY